VVKVGKVEDKSDLFLTMNRPLICTRSILVKKTYDHLSPQLGHRSSFTLNMVPYDKTPMKSELKSKPKDFTEILFATINSILLLHGYW
jgi:hypothetical protein